MPELNELSFGFGQVEFRSAIAEVPATSKTTGNVTVNNAGSPGGLEHFATSFMLNARFAQDGIEFSNIFHWNSAVTGLARETPYSQVEDAAARQLAPMLRAVADRIEQLVADAAAGPK